MNNNNKNFSSNKFSYFIFIKKILDFFVNKKYYLDSKINKFCNI